MLRTIRQRVKALEDRFNIPREYDLDDPRDRRRAIAHFNLMDHAFLRLWWTNFHRVADGVYRSNQPSPARLRRYAERGIRTVLNLRGATGLSYYQLERDACRRLGMTMVDLHLPFSAKTLPPPETLIELERLFRALDKPMVMHCKSGADRAGFAAALYLMMIEGRSAVEADRQLSWRHVHLKSTDTGVLDHFLRYYDRERRRTGIGLMEWIRTEYDREEVTASFREWQAGRWDPQP